jgi:amino-acid N-acetyltransferase
MQIQPAAPRHLDGIRQLLSASSLPDEDLTPAHLEHFFVAEEGETLVGVVGMERYGDVALLRSLAVSAPHRGEGVGRRLTDAIEQHARREGVHELYLLTTTAAGYFEQRGYRRIEREGMPRAIQTTEEAARLCPSSATCMRKRVGDASGESL